MPRTALLELRKLDGGDDAMPRSIVCMAVTEGTDVPLHRDGVPDFWATYVITTIRPTDILHSGVVTFYEFHDSAFTLMEYDMAPTPIFASVNPPDKQTYFGTAMITFDKEFPRGKLRIEIPDSSPHDDIYIISGFEVKAYYNLR
jgi:hypothetical protein